MLTVLLAGLSERAAARLARGYGTALASQVAAMATEPVIAADLASLSALAGRIADDPAVASVSVTALDGRLLAGAPMSARSALVFIGQIEFEDTVIGQVRVALEPRAFQVLGPLGRLGWAAAVVLLGAASVLIGRRLGQCWAEPVDALSRRTALVCELTPVDAPDISAARQVLAQLDANTEPEAGERPANAVTLVNLFDQRVGGCAADAAHARAMEALQRVASLYGGDVELIRGGAVLTWRYADSESVFQGICAALLAARLLRTGAAGEFRIGVHALDEDTPVDGQLVREAVALSSFAGSGEIALSSNLVRLLAPDDERVELRQVAGTTWQALNRRSDSAWLLAGIATRFEALLVRQQAQLADA